MNPQQKPQAENNSKPLEAIGKKFLAVFYMALWILTINAYFTFTPFEHKFIIREWKEEKIGFVIVRKEHWRLNFSGIEISEKLSKGDK